MTSPESPLEQIDRVLDRDAALTFVGHDPGFLNELLDSFHDYRQGIVSRIEEAVKSGDASEVCEATHQLRGALGNFHARAAVTTTLELEDLGHENNLQDAEDLCATLNEELNILCDCVGKLVDELNAE